MPKLDWHPDVEDWFEQLWTRYSSDLTFKEIRKAVQALSQRYVQTRQRHLASALGTAGKRAGFAVFYGPLHFLLVGAICRKLNAGNARIKSLVDLGCGTGVSGAAWALEVEGNPSLLGIDRNRWAVQEAAWMYRQLCLKGQTRCTSLERVVLPRAGSAGIVVAFTANEMSKDDRERLRISLLEAAAGGTAVLIVEPIARRLTPWWDDWVRHFLQAGGRADEWRIPIALPDRLKLMDSASGLDHRELTGRSLWLCGQALAVPPVTPSRLCID